MNAEREPLKSVAEAAARWGVARMTVLRMIGRHEVRAARVGKQWRIPADEVERIATPEDAVSRPAVGEKSAASDASPVGVRRGFGAAPTAGPGTRIFKRPSWETQDTAASRAVGGSRSARTRKRPSAVN